MAAWNAAFADKGTRANKTHRNRFVAIQLYRWINGEDNDGEPRMTEGDVLKAIQAYSEDSWIITKCAGRFQSFGDWLRGCPDQVDKQLSRIHEKRGAGQADKVKNPAAEAAGKLLQLAGLGRLARRATDAEQALVEHVKTWATRRIPGPPATGGRDRHKSERDWRMRAIPIVRVFVDLPMGDRLLLSERAITGVDAYLGRPPTESLADTNLVTAIAIALANHSVKGGNPTRKDDTP